MKKYKLCQILKQYCHEKLLTSGGNDSCSDKQPWVTEFMRPKSVSIVVQCATLSAVSIDLEAYTHEQTDGE